MVEPSNGPLAKCLAEEDWIVGNATRKGDPMGILGPARPGKILHIIRIDSYCNLAY